MSSGIFDDAIINLNVKELEQLALSVDARIQNLKFDAMMLYQKECRHNTPSRFSDGSINTTIWKFVFKGVYGSDAGESRYQCFSCMLMKWGYEII